MMKLNSPVRERRVSHGLSRQQDCPAARAEQRNDEQLSVLMKCDEESAAR